ncbi:hypothetical protein [Rhizobium sp. PL01]|uniref:hypothetical protein n=1 Tax=Rhizobium sp. PL01 TaxID=3085631 RepID=UPI002980AAEB|nr:hypothetical protein [Rhizobium sp. PL01]MDW5314337.1 hypothetical protein [Rhizobium sp. PL01]
MYPLLDHDDFAKTRKALVATAAFLLLINHLQIVGESITILGLNLKINKSTINGFGSLFLLYFIYVFIVRAIEKNLSSKLDVIHQDIDLFMKEFRGRPSEGPVSENKIYFETRVAELISDLKDTGKTLSRFVVLGVEVIPPLLLALYAAYVVGAPAALSSFLKNV